MSDDDRLPETMKTMVLEKPGHPLVFKMVPVAAPLAGQVVVKVIACGVCRTDLHIMDSELEHLKLPGYRSVGWIMYKRERSRSVRIWKP